MNLRAFGAGVEGGRATRPPVLVDARTFNYAANQTARIDTSGRLVTSLIVQVQTGVLDLWFGERDGAAGTIPHLRFQAGRGPEQVWLPPNDYIWTVVAPVLTQGSLILLGS